jgi:hypothetical protein
MNTIAVAAHTVAELEAVANTAADELAALHRHADGIRDRRAALVAERDSIAALRRAGGEADGARLALLGVDVEGIDGLLADATSAVAAGQVRADKARAEAASAGQHLDRLRDEELIARLKPHADQLGDLLLAAVGEIAAASKRLQHFRPDWCPRKDLADSLNYLHLTVGPRQ